MKDTSRFARAIMRVYAGKTVRVHTHRGECYEGVLMRADAESVSLMNSRDYAQGVCIEVDPREILGLSCPDLAPQP